MKRYNLLMRAFTIIILSLAGILNSPAAYGQDNERDPVIQYYLDGVDEKLAENILFVDFVAINSDAKSFYNNIDYRGEVDEADTAKYKLNMKNGVVLDTSIIDSAGLENNTIPDTIRFAKPWEKNCYFYFFPNDTGSGELAIGFEPNVLDSGITPAGIMLIDRSTFQLKELFLHYRSKGNFERFSIEYEFKEHEFGVAPSRITYQGTRSGLMVRQHFRQDIYFDNYRFE